MNKRLGLVFFILVFLFTGSLILFQKPLRLAALPGCPANLLGPAVDWRAQDYDNSQGVTAVQYDETEKCLVLDCDLKGKDLHLSQGEIILDLNYIPCLEANTPLNMTGRLIKATIQVPAGFVGPSSAPNGCQVFVKDTSFRSQYGTWVNCSHSGTFTVKLKPSKVNPYLGQTTTGFDPTKIKTIGIKFGINANSTFQCKGKLKIANLEVTPKLPFSSAPEIPGSLPAPFVTGDSNVDLRNDGFYIGNNKWFIVGGNWRLIDYRQNFGTTAWFPKGNGISLHPGFVATKLGWFRQAGVTLVRVGLLDDGAAMLNRSGKVVGYNERFKKDIAKLLELAAQYNMKVEFSLVDFLIAGKEEENAGVWLKGRRKIIEDAQVRPRFIQNFLTPFLQEFGNSPALFGFDIINEPEWLISKAYGGSWEDVTDLKNKAVTPISFEEFKNFVSQCTAKIRELAPGKFVTIGVSCTNIELLNNLNTNLDYTALHYYPWMGDLVTNLSKAPVNKPWCLEEFPGNGNIYSYFQTVSEVGGAGALSWNLSPEIDDQCYTFEEETQKLQEIRKFYDYYIEQLDPTISLNKINLNFGAEPPGFTTDDQTFLISNSGAGILHWTVSDDAAWLDCTPISGTNSGKITVSINPTGIIPGSYTGTITVSDPAATNSPQIILVSLVIKSEGETEAPFGDFSSPLDGSTVQSSIPVTGWALDDVQVTSVKIYLEQNSQLVYIGDAGFIEGARPDVEQAFPTYPLNYRGGWGYMMLTNFLPNGGNGTFVLHAVAVDVEGHETTLGIKAIDCDNANAVRPFGTIDTPPQGGTVSGNRYRNSGWVLTPQPNNIPINGSTINVYVDSVKLGNANYNLYRSDIAGLLPGYANSNGAGAGFTLDTTAYANGIHVLYWTAADSAGNLDGIGSRYFTIQNNVSGYSTQQINLVQQAKDMDRLREAQEPIGIKKGFAADAGKQVLNPGKNGIFQASLRELERIEIDLDPGSKSPGSSGSSDSYRGYLLVGKHLHSLPVGSTFDNRKGIFYWQPGVGFLGDYNFIFIRNDNCGNSDKKRIDIKIMPKYINKYINKAY